MMASTPWKMDRIRMLRQTAALQPTHRAPKYVVCIAASQPRDLWFQRLAICIVFSFLWIRESNTIWATRDEARSRSYRPDYPRSPKASSRCCPPLLKDSSVILSDAFDNGRHGSCFLSFRIHTCILNTTWTGIVVFAMALFSIAVATKLVYFSSIYCTYYLVLFEVVLCSIGLKNFLSYV